MGVPKAGFAPPERNPLDRPSAAEGFEYEESSDGRDRSGLRRWRSEQRRQHCSRLVTAPISGTAKDEAKKPYTDYSRPRARRDRQARSPASIAARQPRATSHLGEPADRELRRRTAQQERQGGLHRGSVRPDAAAATKNDVVIDCNKIPAAWWLLGAAARPASQRVSSRQRRFRRRPRQLPPSQSLLRRAPLGKLRSRVFSSSFIRRIRLDRIRRFCFSGIRTAALAPTLRRHRAADRRCTHPAWRARRLSGRRIRPRTGPRRQRALPLGPAAIHAVDHVSNLGVDNNVFNEADDPKSDTTAAIGPAVQLWMKLGRRAFHAATRPASTSTSTNTKISAPGTRANSLAVEVPLTRVTPVRQRRLRWTRPSGPDIEIDTRARRRDTMFKLGTEVRVAGKTAFVFSTDYLRMPSTRARSSTASTSPIVEPDDARRAGAGALRADAADHLRRRHGRPAGSLRTRPMRDANSDSRAARLRVQAVRADCRAGAGRHPPLRHAQIRRRRTTTASSRRSMPATPSSRRSSTCAWRTTWRSRTRSNAPTTRSPILAGRHPAHHRLLGSHRPAVGADARLSQPGNRRLPQRRRSHPGLRRRHRLPRRPHAPARLRHQLFPSRGSGRRHPEYSGVRSGISISYGLPQ